MKKLFIAILLFFGLTMTACDESNIPNIDELIKDSEAAQAFYQEAFEGVTNKEVTDAKASANIDLKINAGTFGKFDFNLENQTKYKVKDNKQTSDNSLDIKLLLDIPSEEIDVNETLGLNVITQKNENNLDTYLSVDDTTILNLLKENNDDEFIKMIQELESYLPYSLDTKWIKLSNDENLDLSKLLQENQTDTTDSNDVSLEDIFAEIKYLYDLDTYLKVDDHKTLTYSNADGKLKVSIAYDKEFVVELLGKTYDDIVDFAVENELIKEEEKVTFEQWQKKSEYAIIDKMLDKLDFATDVLIDIENKEIIKYSIDMDLKPALEYVMASTGMVFFLIEKADISLSYITTEDVEVTIPTESILDANKVIEDLLKFIVVKMMASTVTEINDSASVYTEDSYTLAKILEMNDDENTESLAKVFDLNKSTFTKVDNKFVLEAYYTDETKVFITSLTYDEAKNFTSETADMTNCYNVVQAKLNHENFNLELIFSTFF